MKQYGLIKNNLSLRCGNCIKGNIVEITFIFKVTDHSIYYFLHDHCKLEHAADERDIQDLSALEYLALVGLIDDHP